MCRSKWVPSNKRTWLAGTSPLSIDFNRLYIFKWWIFHCYASLPECNHLDSPGCTRHHQDNMTCLGAGISIINHFVSKKNTLPAGRYILTEVILLDGESQAWKTPVTYPILQIMRALSTGVMMFGWRLDRQKTTYLSWLFVSPVFLHNFRKVEGFSPIIEVPLKQVIEY